MSSIATILRHERRAAMADRSLLIALLVFIAAAGYALASGGSWAKARDADIALALQQADQRNADLQTDLRIYEAGKIDTLNKEGWYPGWIKSPLAIGARPSLPSLPVAAIATNAGELQPVLGTLRVATSRYGLFDDARASTQNPATLAVGRFDVVFLLTAVLPLLILAFSHNLLSAELEQGTLALVMVQPVRLTRIVLGKLLVRAGFVLLPALVVVLGGLLLVSGAPTDAQGWNDYAVLAAMMLSYGSFWLLLAALINVRGRSSSANALTLGGIWLALVLVIPSLLNILTLTFYPPPDRAQLTNLLRSTLVDARNGGETLVNDFNLQHQDQPIPADSDTAAYGSAKSILKTWLVSQRTDALVAPVADAFEQRLAEQQQLTETLRFLSPALSFQSALTRLAGADHARTDAFRDAARAFQSEFRAFLVPKIEAGQSTHPDDFDHLPKFSMPPPVRGGALLADWLGIVIPAVLLGVFAAAGFRRYRVGK